MVVDPRKLRGCGWIIDGLYPCDDLGGGLFYVIGLSGLFAAGFVLTSLALILRSLIRKPL